MTFPGIASLPALTAGFIELGIKLNTLDGVTVTNRATLKNSELPTKLITDFVITVGKVAANISARKPVRFYDTQGLGLLAIPANDVMYTIEVKNPGSAIGTSTLEILEPGLLRSQWPQSCGLEPCDDQTFKRCDTPARTVLRLRRMEIFRMQSRRSLGSH